MLTSSPMFLAILGVVALLLSSGTAFAPAPVVYSKMTQVSFISARPLPKQQVIFRMSDTEETETKGKVSADGTYYDDEVEAVPKETLSNSMRDRLIREASTGLDSEKPQTNTILYISIAVAILVLAGGKDILY